MTYEKKRKGSGIEKTGTEECWGRKDWNQRRRFGRCDRRSYWPYQAGSVSFLFLLIHGWCEKGNCDEITEEYNEIQVEDPKDFILNISSELVDINVDEKNMKKPEEIEDVLGVILEDK